jgi:hypothetical protein
MMPNAVKATTAVNEPSRKGLWSRSASIARTPRARPGDHAVRQVEAEEKPLALHCHLVEPLRQEAGPAAEVEDATLRGKSRRKHLGARPEKSDVFLPLKVTEACIVVRRAPVIARAQDVLHVV